MKMYRGELGRLLISGLAGVSVEPPSKKVATDWPCVCYMEQETKKKVREKGTDCRDIRNKKQNTKRKKGSATTSRAWGFYP
jgi:hypothetical protein